MKKICMLSFGDLDDEGELRNGYAVRAWMLARRLQQQGNQVTAYQFTGHGGSVVKDGVTINSMDMKNVTKPTSAAILNKVFGFNPMREVMFQIEAFTKLKKLKKTLAQYDEYYVEGCLLLAPFLMIRIMKRPITLDTHCINKDVALKIRQQQKVMGTVRTAVWHVLEKSLLNRSAKVIVVSENDKEFIKKHYRIHDDRIVIVPNEVKQANREKFEEAAKKIRSELGLQNGKVALFMGDLGAIHNREAEEFIRSELAPATPDINYVLVGHNPNARESEQNLIYTGFVDDLDPYVILSDYCIAPLSIGSGVKTKVLDYLKYHKPIIATPVAVEGIPQDDLQNVYLYERNVFVEGIKSLMGVSKA